MSAHNNKCTSCKLYFSLIHLTFISSAVSPPGQAGEQLGESQRGSPDPEVLVPGAARGAAGRPEGLRARPDHRPAALPALEPGRGLHTAG